MQGAPIIQLASTSALPIGKRFSYWTDVVAQTIIPLHCDTPDRTHFSGQLRHRQIGLVGVTDVRASPVVVRRTKTKIASGPRDDVVVVLQLAGRCNAGQQAKIAQLQPGSGAIVTADVPYFFDLPKTFRSLVVTLPRCLMADDRIGTGRERALLLSVSGARLLRKLALSSLEEPLPLSPEEEVGVERAFAELLHGAMSSSPGEPKGLRTSPHYLAACQFIRRQLADPALTPEAVAAHVKTSTRHLARLFARQGTTIDRTIWLERLMAARRDLVDPRLRDSSITEVAFSWAFTDAAHFSRRFSNAFGLSPAAYRATNLTGRSGGCG
jgi:AraC-like DNA-binding protein